MSKSHHARRPKADVYRYWIMRVLDSDRVFNVKHHEQVGRPINDKLEALSKARRLAESTKQPHDVVEGRSEPLIVVASFTPGEKDFRPNPGAGVSTEAVAKFREFHRKDPRKTGLFHDDMIIPERAFRLGESVHVLYRSDKVDPDTGQQPKKPIDYIHEHDSWGVETYGVERPRRNGGGDMVEVPAFIRDADGLVLLGACLGIAFRQGNGVVELGAKPPHPELYTTPCGRALLVISGKRELDYLVWGGGLGVEDVGIVG